MLKWVFLGEKLIRYFVCFREALSPAVITDLSYNGTFVNGHKIGKGNSRVLDDKDEISLTLPTVKSMLFFSIKLNNIFFLY